MPSAARDPIETARGALDIFERIRDAFGDDDQGNEETEGNSEREEVLADVLDASEEAQAQLAAALTVRGLDVAQKAHADDEAAALAAVILRALAAHTQAEAMRSLIDAPDLSQFVNVHADETMPHDWGEEGGGDD